MQSLRKNLLEEIEDAFPEETEAYRLIRTQAAAVHEFEVVN